MRVCFTFACLASLARARFGFGIFALVLAILACGPALAQDAQQAAEPAAEQSQPQSGGAALPAEIPAEMPVSIAPATPTAASKASSPVVKEATVSLTSEQLKRISDSEALVKTLSKDLDDIDRELLPENALVEDRLVQLRSTLRAKRSTLLQWQSDLEVNADPLRLKLADLGPAPEAEGQAEDESLASLRADFEALLTPFESLATQFEALIMQIDRQLDVIAERRRDLFLANIFTPTPAIFSLEFWRVVPTVVSELSQATSSLIAFRVRAIATKLNNPGQISSLVIFALVIGLLGLAPGVFLRRYARRRNWSLEGTSSRAAVFARAHEVLWPPLWLVASFAGFLLLYQTSLNLVASFSWLVMSLGAGLAAALLVLRLPAWLDNLASAPALGAYLHGEPGLTADDVGKRLSRDLALVLAAMTLLVCLQLTVQGLIDIFVEPVESEWLTVLVFAPVQILALVWLMKPQRYRRLFMRFFPWIFGALPLRWALRRSPWLAGIGLILGFIALVGFVMPRMWLVLMGFVLAAGLRASLYLWLDLGAQGPREDASDDVKASAVQSVTPDEPVSTGESANDIRRFWRVLAVNTLLVAVGLPLGLMLLGYDAVALLEWLDRLAQPLSLGSLQLSPFNLVLGVGLFALAWMAVRYVKVVMAEQVLPRTSLMADVRHSLVTLLGYVGFTIAGLVGLGVAGLDLSRFALIAGALSVGIGFGLQAIVSNFVSGLILLFERPVKLGDWVVLSSGEGIVKRISIRATEIETFDGRAIMVPNSELITAPVANWTHRSHKGRVMISVGVAYESDPKQVEAILYKVANNNPLVLRAPAPVVYLANFGDSSLDFQLRVHIADIFNVLTVSHQIRLAIFEAFQEQSISIPFPQQELRIKTEVEGVQVASPVFQVEPQSKSGQISSLEDNNG